MKQKFMGMLLAVTFLCSLCPPSVMAEELNDYIVELKSEPVYKFTEPGEVSLQADDTPEEKEYKICSEQEAFENETRKIGDIPIEFSYSQIFNGMKIKATTTQIEKIKNLDNVKAIYDDNNVSSEAVRSDIGSGMNSASMRDNIIPSGYDKGEGMLIAVVDTSFDVNHEAFTLTDVSKAKLKSKSDVEEFIDKSLSIGSVTANQVFKNNKIPFAYDYADKDADVYDSSATHGNHVAGIAGGNSETLQGVCPETQLVLMKVYSDKTQYGSTSVLMAAVDDAVKMGVDAINLSSGSTFSNCPLSGVEYTVLKNLSATPVQYYNSAGNSGFGIDTQNKAYTSEVSYASGGSPAGYDYAQTVGNSYGSNLSAEFSVFYTEGDKKNYCSDAGGSNFTSDMTGTNEYVIGGYGTDEELDNVDASGKIVVVKKGHPYGSTYTSLNKKNAIQNHGGIAMMFANESDFTTLYDMGGFPSAVITMDTYNSLEQNDVKTITINGEKEKLTYPNKMNSSSSYVTNERLTGGVDITAAGTNVLSSVNNDEYDYMTGTSMSCPAACGAFTLAKSYFESKYSDYCVGKEETPQIKTTVSTLMQNTADILCDDKTDVPYSPRLQGAGYINLEDFTNNDVVLSDQSTGRGMTYCGETQSNNIKLSLQMENLSDDEVVYDKISGIALRDKVDGEYIVGTEYASASFSLPESISVMPHSVTTFDIEVSISEEERERLDAIFENGFFLDGFLKFESTGGSEELTYPFTSFIGDWSKAPMIDKGYYENTNLYSGAFIAYESEEGVVEYVSGESMADGTRDASKIAVSTTGDLSQENYKAVYFFTMLRTNDYGYLTIKDSLGKQVAKTAINGRSYDFHVCDIATLLSGKPEGNYTMTYNCGNNKTNISDFETYNVYLDETAPQIKSVVRDGNDVVVTASDNFDLNAVGIKSEDDYIYVNSEKVGDDYVARFENVSMCRNVEFKVVDCAFNSVSATFTDSGIVLTDDVSTQDGSVFKQSIKLNNYNADAVTGIPMLAIYDGDNRLLYIDKADEVNIAGESNADVSFEINNSGSFTEGCKKRFFFWDGMTPLINEPTKTTN